MALYVETRIRGSIDELWRLTQTPELHEQWDLRFTSITYLEREDESAPQRFRYATRIGFGAEISGWGETVGARDEGGKRSSALRFGSEDRRSLIREGSGYWKYEPTEDGIRFLTGYDYEVRGGFAGRALDRVLFRPLMGWATAWSFDRLRLWLERGIDPRGAARQALVHGIASFAVTFVWIWHGLIPKLAGPHADELAMLLEAGVSEDWVRPAVRVLGSAELAFGLAFVPLAKRRWPWILTIVLMGVATVGVLSVSPERALAAFNPITLNVLLAALATVGLCSLENLPSARRCLRVAPKRPTESSSS